MGSSRIRTAPAKGSKQFHIKFRTRWRHIIEIDGMIRSGQAPNASQLAEKLEVSRRTIMRDLDFLRYDLGAPLRYDHGLRGFVYAEPNWSMPNLRISEGELLAMMIGEKALQAYAGTPWAAKLKKVFERLMIALPERLEIGPGELLPRMEFDLNAASIVDPGVLQTISEAIEKNRTLRMRYFALARGEEREYEIDPYVMRSAQGCWYLAAKDHRSGHVPLFNLSRVREVQPTGDTFDYEDSGFDPEEYFAGTFGVHHSTEKIKVVVEFSGFAARLVSERLWHSSQKLKELPGQRLRFEAEVSHLDDLWPWVLSWGGEAVVIEPPELVQIVAEQAGKIASNYRGQSRGR